MQHRCPYYSNLKLCWGFTEIFLAWEYPDFSLPGHSRCLTAERFLERTFIFTEKKNLLRAKFLHFLLMFWADETFKKQTTMELIYRWIVGFCFVLFFSASAFNVFSNRVKSELYLFKLSFLIRQNPTPETPIKIGFFFFFFFFLLHSWVSELIDLKKLTQLQVAALSAAAAEVSEPSRSLCIPYVPGCSAVIKSFIVFLLMDSFFFFFFWLIIYSNLIIWGIPSSSSFTLRFCCWCDKWSHVRAHAALSIYSHLVSVVSHVKWRISVRSLFHCRPGLKVVHWSDCPTCATDKVLPPLGRALVMLMYSTINMFHMQDLILCICLVLFSSLLLSVLVFPLQTHCLRFQVWS